MTKEFNSFSEMIAATLNRMRRAHERGTGCYLTAGMVHALSVSLIGEVWSEVAEPEGRP